MSDKTFKSEIEKKIKMMKKEELYEFTLSILEYIPKENRNLILDLSKDSDDISSKKKYDRAISLLEAISNESKYLNISYYEEYYDYYDCDESSESEDPYNIEDDLKEIIDIAKIMFLKKEYKYAKGIYDKMLNLKVLVSDEISGEQEYFDFDEASIEVGLRIDTHRLLVEALYITYMITEKNLRVKTLYKYFAWYDNSIIKLEEIIDVANSSLPEFDSFLIDWINLLKNEEGKDIMFLLEDAFLYLEGKESYEKYAKELYNKFPSYYVNWFKDLLENNKYEKIISEALESFKVLKSSSEELYLTANIVYSASKELNDADMIYLSSKVMFESNPCVKTFLILKTFGYTTKLVEDIDTSIVRDKTEKTVIDILFGNHLDVLEQIKRNRISIDWSYNIKGIVVPLFLVLLVDVDDISDFIENTIISIQSRLDYKKELDDLDLIEYYKLWRENIVISDQDKALLLKYCKKEVDNRVEAIVSNKYRNAYIRAASISYLLSEICFIIGDTNDKYEMVNKHKEMFPRHIAFKREYDNL